MAISKFLLFSLSLTLVVGFAWSFDFHEKELETEDRLWDMYERWRSHHKVAENHLEKRRRFNVFKSNVLHVHETNKMDKPYKLKLNKFADMTNHEFRSLYAGSKIKHHRMLRGDRIGNKTFRYANVESVPTSVDWRNKGAVTPKNDEQSLMKAVAHQPVSVAIDAGGEDFQFGKCGTQLDHGVAAVGYGITQDGTKYWIVKNSWGAEWGEKGYIRMQRDILDKQGLCGIAMEASYPIKISSDNPKSSPKDEL